MAKYDSVRKVERNRILLEYRKANPDASLAEIGRLFNISKQRVSEILKKEGNKIATTSSVVATRGERDEVGLGPSSPYCQSSTPQSPLSRMKDKDHA